MNWVATVIGFVLGSGFGFLICSIIVVGQRGDSVKPADRRESPSGLSDYRDHVKDAGTAEGTPQPPRRPLFHETRIVDPQKTDWMGQPDPQTTDDPDYMG